MSTPNKLPTIEMNGITYTIDFRLREIRSTEGLKLLFFPFKHLPEDIKARLRGIRCRELSSCYIEGLDD